jgi:hypothetical protein
MNTNQPRSLAEYLTLVENRVRQAKDTVYYVVFDTSKGKETIVGVIGYYRTNVMRKSTNIGPVLIFPEFRVRLYYLAFRGVSSAEHLS